MGKTSYEVNYRYQKKAYERVSLRVIRGQGEVLKAYAASQGLTVCGLIKNLLEREVPGFKAYRDAQD